MKNVCIKFWTRIGLGLGLASPDQSGLGLGLDQVLRASLNPAANIIFIALFGKEKF